MLAANIQAEVDRFARRYRSFGFALKGALNQALDSPDLLSPVTVNRLRERLFEIYSEARSIAISQIMVDGNDVIDQAMKDVVGTLSLETPETFRGLIQQEIGPYISQVIGDASISLGHQMFRDMRAMERYFREFALTVQSVMISTGRSQRSAQTMVRLQKRSPDLLFLDRAGRRWKSERYVSTLVGTLMVDLYNEIYVYALRMNGITTAKVRMPDPAHANHDIEFSIGDPGSSLPLYEDLKEEVFHPNSYALVVAK